MIWGWSRLFWHKLKIISCPNLAEFWWFWCYVLPCWVLGGPWKEALLKVKRIFQSNQTHIFVELPPARRGRQRPKKASTRLAARRRLRVRRVPKRQRRQRRQKTSLRIRRVVMMRKVIPRNQKPMSKRRKEKKKKQKQRRKDNRKKLKQHERKKRRRKCQTSGKNWQRAIRLEPGWWFGKWSRACGKHSN